ncbi:hypothetical protein [Mucilaginibacter sp.]|jgi:hypothetical protein|uniref:hypothetical protein n=1 Tax=Mucilaginibacter sp. TaxID=1882438 RepID=UPI002C519F8E|nr:hypothetical protein [Mucilaginibacter sp.]HTI61021.1 hypothetical protein [Mucilaginibacter sp.]
MGIFDLFKRNKKTIRNERSSSEQVAFAESVLLIISPTIEKFGFKRVEKTIKEYSTTITFRKRDQYIKVENSSYPTDYPYYYFIVLGEGSSDDFFEYDWNSVSLAALANIVDPTSDEISYWFPLGDSKFAETIKESIEKANQDILKYGATFLDGDLSMFYQARKKANEGREPYKISKMDENGAYQTTLDPESAAQKKKYS